MGWLEVLGAIFLLLLSAAAYYGFKLYRWIKRSAIHINEMALVQTILPPINVELHEAPEADWTSNQRLRADQRWLAAAGFTHAGDFDTVMGRAEALISLWGHADKRLCCAIYEVRAYLEDRDEFHTVYAAELYQAYADGGSLTVSNNPDAGLLPRAAEHRLEVVTSAQLAELYERLVAQAPHDASALGVDNVVHTFQNFVESFNSWLWEEAQLRSPIVAELLAKVGVVLDEALIEQLLAHARCEKSELLSSKVLRRLSERADMTAASWEKIRSRMVVVHQQMTAEELIGCYYELLGEVSEKDEARIEAFAELDHIACPVTLFSSRLTQLKAANRIKLVAKMEKPILSNVYMPKAP
jgi:hypothetical protein